MSAQWAFFSLVVALCMLLAMLVYHVFRLQSALLRSTTSCATTVSDHVSFQRVELVCSRGILYSTTWHSASPRSSSVDVSHLSAAVLHALPGDSIYVCTETLPVFIHTWLSLMRVPFVLVAGDSDETIDASSNEFNDLFASSLLIAFFGQNMVNPRTRCVQMPIGLDYHTVMAGNGRQRHAWLRAGDGTQPSEQEAVLKQTLHASQSPRVPNVYANFGAMDKRGDRASAISTVPPELLVYDTGSKPRADVWQRMATHAFVLSPFGNGFDCHRTWEALALGAIPIVRGQHFATLFEGLCVMQVSEWRDVTRENLDAFLQQQKQKQKQKQKQEQEKNQGQEQDKQVVHWHDRQKLAFWVQAIQQSGKKERSN